MLKVSEGWARIAEVNPPDLPDMTHLRLDGAWSHVMVTDNVFGRIRVSPYAFAARLTHDVPGVHPTVVVSTRDRNILAIESEIRGALGNGVDSFLVVNGDTLPHVDHLAHHHEIVDHLRKLQEDERLPEFEVGMPTRFREWQYRQRIERGAQFLVAGPVLDPDVVAPRVEELGIRPDDPPVYLMVNPPFSTSWIARMEAMGHAAATDALKRRLLDAPAEERRRLAWSAARDIEAQARESGCAGIILTGLRYETVVGEAATELRRERGLTPTGKEPT